MQTKRSNVFTIIAKDPILSVLLSSEYGFSIYNLTDFKRMTPQVLQILQNCFSFLCQKFCFPFITLT